MRRLAHCTSALALTLFACNLPAQYVAVAVSPLQDVVRPIPARPGFGLGASATKVVRLDSDGDFLHDVAILWSNGEVVFGHGVEVQSSFQAMPATGVTGIARIPAAFALTGTDPCDGLLTAGNNGIAYLWLGNGTAFTSTPVNPPGSWTNVARLESAVVGNACLLAGLDTDRHTVRIGAFAATGIVPSATVQLGNELVQEVEFVAYPDQHGNPIPCLAVRTDVGLRQFDLAGTRCGTVDAPTVGEVGALTSFQDGATQKLAWIVQTGWNWLLRIHTGPALSIEQQFAFGSIPGVMPSRFAPIGIAAFPYDGFGHDALLLQQSTTPNQLILVKDAQSLFKPSGYVPLSGITYPTDVCPGIVTDINNDDHVDFATVLTSSRQLRIETGLPQAYLHAALNQPLAPDQPDFLAPDGTLLEFTNTNASLHGADGLELKFRVPQGMPVGACADIVCWTQNVWSPALSPFQDQPYSNSKRYVSGPLDTTLSRNFRFNIPGMLTNPLSGWATTTEYFFLLRMITRNASGAITWSSTSQMVGFVATDLPQVNNEVPSAQLAYLNSVSSGGGPPYPRCLVPGQKEVGLVQKPRTIHLNYDLLIPNLASLIVLLSSGSW